MNIHTGNLVHIKKEKKLCFSQFLNFFSGNLSTKFLFFLLNKINIIFEFHFIPRNVCLCNQLGENTYMWPQQTFFSPVRP